MIQRDGLYHVRTRGSRRQFRHPEKLGTVTIHGHPGDDMKTGTWDSVLRQAGLKLDFAHSSCIGQRFYEPVEQRRRDL